MKRPFFSIVIITYNRASFLKANLSILLQQSFKDYEVIISDNASTDKTREVIESFKDKRIRYLRNKRNIGFPKNARKAILAACGKYIFTLGDDDFILFADTLSYLKKFLDKKGYGVVRLNILERDYSGPNLQKKLVGLNEDKAIESHEEIKKILDFYRPVDIGMMSGIIFKNENITPGKFIICETYPWFNIIVENTQKYGAYFLSNYYMVITWTGATNKQPSWVVRTDGSLEFEPYDRALFKFIPKNNRQSFRLNYYKSFIRLLPVIKFYSTNRNLIRFVRRLIQLVPILKNDIKLWTMFFTSLLIPKFIWLKVRLIYHRVNNNIDIIPNLDSINTRYKYLLKRYYQFLYS